jgi:hypothetical protein
LWLGFFYLGSVVSDPLEHGEPHVTDRQDSRSGRTLVRPKGERHG